MSPKHGGRRRGSGRPRGRSQTEKVIAYLTPEQRAWVRAQEEQTQSSASAVLAGLVDQARKGTMDRYQISFAALCDIYGIPADDHDVEPDTNVVLYTDAGGWHVSEPVGLTDAEWAPRCPDQIEDILKVAERL